MSRKLPPDAFSYYLSLGEGRSYDAVAEQFGVSKRAVGKLAKKERWQERVDAIEKEARDRLHEKAVDSLEEMNMRHLRTLRVIQARGLEALQSMPLTTAMDAVRALGLAIKTERVIAGEPSDRQELSVHDKIRDEYARWLSLTPDEAEDLEEADDDEG